MTFDQALSIIMKPTPNQIWLASLTPILAKQREENE